MSLIVTRHGDTCARLLTRTDPYDLRKVSLCHHESFLP